MDELQDPDARSITDLLRASRRDDDAFAMLYRLLVRDVFSYIARSARDAEAARDLTAETFARVLESRARFHGLCRESGRAWVFGIARNVVREHARARGFEHAAVERLGIELHLLDAVDEAADPRPEPVSGLDRLPAEQREAVRLRVIEERAYPEIAVALGCSEETVRQRVSRGLKSLKEIPKGQPW